MGNQPWRCRGCKPHKWDSPMKRLERLRFNDPAPDVQLETADAKPIRLASLWAEKTLLLVFTRHFGCPHCKEMLHLLVQFREELNRSGLTIAAVTQGSPSETAEYCKQYAEGILCLSDPDRKAYRAYGLGKGGLWQLVASPQVITRTRRVIREGHSAELAPKGQDMRQMSGSFVIGVDGRIRLPYYYDTIADHPPIDLLLKGVLSTSWDKPFDAPLG